ncbi:TPA: hypothetical protein ACXNHW_005616 [Pseudomonas aeruginosa]
MEKSFSDHIVEILEITEGNPALKDLLLNMFFNNPPDGVSRNIKKVLDTYQLKPRVKSGWDCQHKGCKKKSCASHEISENAVLKNICSHDSNVVILKKTLKVTRFFILKGHNTKEMQQISLDIAPNTTQHCFPILTQAKHLSIFTM